MTQTMSVAINKKIKNKLKNSPKIKDMGKVQKLGAHSSADK